MIGLVLNIALGVGLAALERWGKRTRRPYVVTGVHVVIALMLVWIVAHLLGGIIRLGLSVSIP